MASLEANSVSVKGKVSRRGPLKYTPSGVPVWEFTLAVPQVYFEKNSTGYFEVLIYGKAAEEDSAKVKIGQTLSLNGTLWSRTYNNRQGVRVSEVKILVDSTTGESHEEN